QQHCIDTLQELFGIREEDIYVKSRTRKKTTGQYEKVNETNTFFTVNENGIQFLVNLSDYVDTGLFLDHRNTRKRVMSEAKGKHVLNLFAYTGSFSVYAAMGNAFTTTTLDLSGTYLNWAKENFKLNQIPLSKHQFIQTDAKEWVKQAPARLYDIIILDPPTISTSEKTKTNFDVQTDHAELINNTLNHLQPGGILYFSNNFRNFVLDAEKIRSAIIEDISQQSVPLDFRNKKIHACWRIVKI
ncbi:MAG: class I SAM-dependent methyltransferase, partial [Chitinophagaceae bacterium]|nr:class I SAM-dependent methyltransferase [Chitinophagaceae bacterium]